MIGTSLRHYRIIEKLGAGGMGEVYRAEDTTLSRHVAIKVLPDEFASDPERLARFEREAKVLASLNHPNIAAIHGLEQADGKRFIVMELVEGQTLAQRLLKGPLPVDEAVEVCRQTAEGLEAAHEKGVIHRDLKPANIQLSPEGKVKILDFGLARAFQDQPSEVDQAHSPTITEAMTRPGVVLGTAAYMSPEQAKGKAVDKRADIWAFGCVLFEMLTGKRAFPGETHSDVVAAILVREPDWNALPAATPASIRRLLARTLAKDADRRLHDIADARIEIEDARVPAHAVLDAAPKAAGGRSGLLRPLLACAICAAVAAGLAWHLKPSEPVPLRVTRLAVTLPAGEQLSGSGIGLAVAPDGRHVAYVADRDGVPRLHVRALDSLEPRVVVRSENALHPFFSPDGEWIGFFADASLKKVATRGGEPTTIAGAPASRGGTWGPDGRIIFAPYPGGGLMRVSSAGGEREPLTTLDERTDETGHRWPEILPGGKAMLYSVTRGSTLSWDDTEIVVHSLEKNERRVVLRGTGLARYAPTGHIVYARSGALMAVPFDSVRLEVTGPPVTVLQGIVMNDSNGSAEFALSAGGLLAYAPGGGKEGQRTLLWVDRKGSEQLVTEVRRSYYSVCVSGDGRRLAYTIPGPTEGVWVHDLERGTDTRVTVEGNSYMPIWTTDGKQVTYLYTSARDQRKPELFRKAVDGSGPPEHLVSAGMGEPMFPGSWSPDGRTLAFARRSSQTGWDLWTFSIEQEKASPILQTPFNEANAKLSPDGSWLAYQSDESGRAEVYVQRFPGLGARWQISSGGGHDPVWGREGRQLFYRNGAQVMAVGITSQPAFRATKPTLLFQGSYAEAYDYAPGRDRFVMIREAGPQSTQLNVVLNWFEELKRLVPTGKK